MNRTEATQRLKGTARRVLGPTARRLGVTPAMFERGPGARAQMDARLEQIGRAQERLEAYIDRTIEERQAQDAELREAFDTARAILQVLRPEEGATGAGAALERRLDHALLHADAQAAQSRLQFDRDLADMRSSMRLTQALVERAIDTPSGGPVGGSAPASDGAGSDGDPADRPSARWFDHPVPSFDVLYRSFEDHHRGSPDEILDRQRDDYLALLTELPNPELPIADLGCGRGELVRLLESTGQPAVGVDSNLGQVNDAQAGTYHEADLFDWLDKQDDASCRAVVAMHVIEHLPVDLQIRLVFEARRVLAPGGALVLETPNTLSLNIAATNFWVDPTHQRPVHPMFLEFLATEAGLVDVQTRFLHPIPVEFPSTEDTAALVADLNSLILGAGDLALVARR